MRVLVDTSVVVGFVARGQARHAASIQAVKQLQAADHELFLVPQVCYEFWVVATRPAADNGLGMSPTDAAGDLDRLTELFTLLKDERAVFEYWRQIVEASHVSGKPAHDARLVAAMRRHRLEQVLTFNAADFRRFAEVRVLEPGEIASL